MEKLSNFIFLALNFEEIFLERKDIQSNLFRIIVQELDLISCENFPEFFRIAKHSLKKRIKTNYNEKKKKISKQEIKPPEKNIEIEQESEDDEKEKDNEFFFYK